MRHFRRRGDKWALARELIGLAGKLANALVKDTVLKIALSGIIATLAALIPPASSVTAPEKPAEKPTHQTHSGR